MTDKVWKGTWKPDGTGGWHTKSDEDIVEEYHSARRTMAPEKMLSKSIDEIIRLREKNKELRAALNPFANMTATATDDPNVFIYNFTCDDIRAAVTALND